LARIQENQNFERALFKEPYLVHKGVEAMQAREIMTENPACCSSDTSLKESNRKNLLQAPSHEQ